MKKVYFKTFFFHFQDSQSLESSTSSLDSGRGISENSVEGQRQHRLQKVAPPLVLHDTYAPQGSYPPTPNSPLEAPLVTPLAAGLSQRVPTIDSQRFRILYADPDELQNTRNNNELSKIASDRNYNMGGNTVPDMDSRRIHWKMECTDIIV